MAISDGIDDDHDCPTQMSVAGISIGRSACGPCLGLSMIFKQLEIFVDTV
jgi:hypothetical protein